MTTPPHPRPFPFRRAAALAGLLILGLSWHAAAADPRLFRWAKTVEFEAVQAPTEPAAVELDAAVFEATNAELGDLRLVTAAGVDVPFALEPAFETVTDQIRANIPIKVLSVNDDPNGASFTVSYEIQWVGAKEEWPEPRGVTLHTPLREFQRLVDVEGSPDNRAWSKLATKKPVFDSARYQGFSCHDIPLADEARSCRFFRVTILNPDESQDSPYRQVTREFRNGEPAREAVTATSQTRTFQLERLDLWGYRQRPGVKRFREQDYPAQQVTVTDDPQEKRTLVEIACRREPVQQIRLRSSSPQFIRAADVYGRREDGSWEFLASGSLHRFPDTGESGLALAIPLQRRSAYQVRIHNRDNAPLADLDASLRGPVQRLVFPAPGGDALTLLYGAPNVRAADTDYASVLEHRRATGDDRLQATRLGDPMANPAFDGSVTPAVPWSQRPYAKFLLALAVIAAMAALAVGIYRAAHALPPADRS